MRALSCRGGVRLLVLPLLALPVVLGVVVLPGPAWARGGGAKPVTCLLGTASNGMRWNFLGCTQPANLTGGTGTISSLSLTAPPATASIMWGTGANPNFHLTTTFSIVVTPFVGHRDKCGKSMGQTLQEYRVSGRVLSNAGTGTAAVTGKIKWYTCLAANGTITDLGGKRFPKPMKF